MFQRRRETELGFEGRQGLDKQSGREKFSRKRKLYIQQEYTEAGINFFHIEVECIMETQVHQEQSSSKWDPRAISTWVKDPIAFLIKIKNMAEKYSSLGSRMGCFHGQYSILQWGSATTLYNKLLLKGQCLSCSPFSPKAWPRVDA